MHHLIVQRPESAFGLKHTARNLAEQRGVPLLPGSGLLADGNNGFYYQSFDSAVKTEGDMLQALHVLAQDVGVMGVFSDWPTTTTFYANCMNLR